MKIKISKRKLKIGIISVLLIALLVSCNAKPILAAALPQGNPVTSGKLIDMCLTRSGKVVNADIREDVLTQTRNVLNDTAQSYWQWCKDNGKSKSVETFREYLESDAYASLPFRLSKFPLNLASFINWIITGETLLDAIGTDVNEVLTESDDLGNVSVPSETVNIINQCFDSVRVSYDDQITYMDVLSVDEMPSSWFGSQGAYEYAKAYIMSSDRPTIVHKDKQYGKTSLYFGDNTKDVYHVATKGSNFGGGWWDNECGYRWYMYDYEWTEHVAYYAVSYNVSQFYVNNAETFEQYKGITTGLFYSKSRSLPWNHTVTDENYETTNDRTNYYIFGKTSGTVVVYHSLQAVKDYSLGKQPYYTTNRQYSDSVDNSFNVSGEYIQNNGGTFAYEQIREQINNSNVTNDSSVSNIVNDYSQTIINNYNYSSGGNGDNGNSGNGDNNDSGISILDGLGKIITAITDIIGFLLGVLGDVISLVTSLLTTLFDMIKGLGSVFGSFSGLLGELFVFIPQQFIDLLTASMSIMVVVAIWKMIKK